ncbi:glycosyltransferase family 4 protein [Shewanella algae]|uniref:glycosyltransferase family 4 protein n=1 Tax=Shewanella algae TaxID=38313 RepID=UPI0031F52BA4
MTENNRGLIILIASNLSHSGGGRETWISNFVNSSLIIDYYEEIYIICIGAEPKDAIVFNDKVNVTRCSYSSFSSFIKFILFSRKELGKIIKNLISKRIDIISCGSWVESISLYLGLRFRQRGKEIKSICWIRSIAVKELKRIYPKFILPICAYVENSLLGKHDIVIANGNDTADYYQKLGISCHIIPNSIHLNKFKPTSAVEPRFVYCGRLSIEKGVAELVSSITSLSSRGIKFSEIDFIGSGPELARTQAILASIPQVYFKGSVSQEKIPEVLRDYNISFHLTLSGDLGGGGISHSVLESLASGHLIVCWDSPIYRQIEGSENFFLVPEGNVQILADTIEYLSRDNIRDDLISHSRNSAEKYSFDLHLKKYLRIVELE